MAGIVMIDVYIKRFERDMVDNLHSPDVALERSFASKEILNYGRWGLGAIAENLKNFNPPSQKQEIRRYVQGAWSILLRRLGEDWGMRDYPAHDNWVYDFEGWQQWAEKHSLKVTA
jgi:hypothetical protein